MTNYDTWKTSPPERQQLTICKHCTAELYDGEDIYKDHRTGELYCDDTCFRNDMKKPDNIDDELREYIDYLENNGNSGRITLDEEEV